MYQVAASDRATNLTTAPFTVTRDTAPPQVWLEVSRRVYTTTIPLAWGATDDASGVARYDVEVSTAGGPWTAWLTDTSETEATYVAGAGEWFAFRVLATDNVGNAASTEAQSGLARVTKYYYHAGRRIAQRRDGVVYYLHGEHLGSTALVTGQTSNVIARRLFRPYGEERHRAGCQLHRRHLPPGARRRAAPTAVRLSLLLAQILPFGYNAFGGSK